jgi:mannosyltransferase OCH1-like enzyme
MSQSPACKSLLAGMITSNITRRLQGFFGPRSRAPFHAATGHTRIPKQLRFVWGMLGGGELPSKLDRNLRRWRELHQGWNLTVHDGQEVGDLAARYSEYPFASYGKAIQRCDICRLMLLDRYGGVYTDLDVEPTACLDGLFSHYPRANLLLGVEVCLSRKESGRIGREMAIRQGIPEVRRRIANFFMASVPGHPFWKAALQLAKSRASLPVRSQYDILYTTGPDVITETLHRNAKRFSDIAVVPQRLLEQFIGHQRAGSWRDF